MCYDIRGQYRRLQSSGLLKRCSESLLDILVILNADPSDPIRHPSPRKTTPYPPGLTTITSTSTPPPAERAFQATIATCSALSTTSP